MKRLNEHDEHCKMIAEKLENYASGKVRKCPFCHTTYGEDGEEAPTICEECEDETEELGLMDFFENCFDIEYRVSSKDCDYINSVKIMVACGGPNIYIDTATKNVELYWWTDSGKWSIDDDVCDEINELFNEFYHC